MPRLSSLFFAFGVLFACTVLGGCAQNTTVAGGPSTPGWTGSTIVPGNRSTIAGDAEATYLAQKWPLGGRH